MEKLRGHAPCVTGPFGSGHVMTHQACTGLAPTQRSNQAREAAFERFSASRHQAAGKERSRGYGLEF
jgi:hypothetical protein